MENKRVDVDLLYDVANENQESSKYNITLNALPNYYVVA
jgi:hypothetical protein